MKKIGRSILYVFLLKLFKAWSFEKLQDNFWPFSTKNYRFSMDAIQNQVSPFFCFAPFDSFKALTDCSEKLEI